MNIERSLASPFKDEHWVEKLLLGGVFTLLFFTVFFAFVVAGFGMRVLCNAIDNREGALPDWNDQMGLFNDGLLPTLIALIYTAPLLLTQLLWALFGVLFGMNPVAQLVLGGVFGFALLIGGLLVSYVLPAALLRFAVIGDLKAAFDLPKVFGHVAGNGKSWAVTWLVTVFLFGTIAGAGVLVVFVGGAFSLFIAMLMTAHFYGHRYREGIPFPDDKNATLRASITVPPPLPRP